MQQTSEIKLKVVLIIIVLILTILTVTAFWAKKNDHSEDRTLPEKTVLEFPSDYPVLEGVDPEERVLFEGFRTSFLPDEELMLCQFNSKSKRDLPDDNDTSDVMFLWDFPEEVETSTRLKRKSNSSSNNDTTRFGLNSTEGKKKNQISSKSADHDNNEFENNHLEEEEYGDDDHYEAEGHFNNGNYEKSLNYKNYEGFYEKENKQEDELQGKYYEVPHPDYPHYLIKEDENASDTFLRNSPEEDVNRTTKLKRKCMNDSNNDIEVPYYYFEGSKKEKNNSVSFKNGNDIEEEDFRDYEEPHVNKGNIARKSSKKYWSKKNPKGSRKLKRKTDSKSDSGSDNGTCYNDDYDNYYEGDDEQKDGGESEGIERGSDNGTCYNDDDDYDNYYERDEEQKCGDDDKSDDVKKDDKNEAIERGSDNGTCYNDDDDDDYDNYYEGDEEQKHGDNDKSDDAKKDDKNEAIERGSDNGTCYNDDDDYDNYYEGDKEKKYGDDDKSDDVKKDDKNEAIERGSDNGTWYSDDDDYDNYYEGDKEQKDGDDDKSDHVKKDDKNEAIERKKSKNKCSKKKLKGSRKLKRKTNSKRDSDSDNGTCYNDDDDYDNYYEGDEEQKDRDDDKSDVKKDNEIEGIERKKSKNKCSKKKLKGSRKLKRKTNSKRDSGSNNGTYYDDDYDNYYEGDEEQKDGDDDKSDDVYQDNENEGIESMVRPETHVDRGPLDDVVEQVRGQPELEEGEMPSAVHLYKPSKLHSGIHAFYKGQGDKNTIRATQASIMRRNMDAEADPCQDFYQYACGNWAALNPIPADKAGYDTFEMLRENLDSILKDLLEFNKDEDIKSKYPGPHLDTKDNLLKGINYQNPNNNEQYQTTIKVQLSEGLKGTKKRKSRYHWKKPEQEKSEIVNRIRHILNRTSRATLKEIKAHHTKIFHAMIRQPFQRHKRRLKQKRLVKQSFKHYPRKKYPRKKFTLKRSNNPDTVFRRRKIQAINGNRKHKPKREVKCKNPEPPSNNSDETAGDAAMKARFLFKSCMNYAILQKRGHQPLLDLLNLLGGWPILDPSWDNTDFDWLELMAKLRVYNNDILISEWVGPDIKNSDEFVIQFDQTSLGLPTREYFLQDSNKVYLNAYKNYLIKIALLLGGDDDYVKESAEKLIDFEIKLAKITSAPEDRRNVSELYRRMTLQKLENMVPEVKWRRYLCVVMNRTVYPNETVVLFALNYVRHLVTLIHKTDSRILSNYLLWRFVRHRVNNLDDRFQSAKQQFYFILFGREQAPSRWKNCISQVNSNMGMALGSMFVKKYFDETSKNDTLTMTREIQQSFRELLHKINWIDNDTKKLAAHKVDAMMLRIGYPNFILNKDQLNERYKEVRIHPDKYFENILNILQHLTQMEQSRIGQPVNKTLWNTAPAVVNAYYSRNKNQIMFPAGILQPPFYHRHFPRSLNYGGIGVVIGHEITHGFDDKGRLFDCNGNLHRWWSDTAIESFHRRAQCLIDQYGQYIVPEVNMKLDGVNTQGENIADNGGVKQAFRAYRHWVQQHGTEGETLPGLNHTHTQLFFLNFAQVWCGAMRPEAMRNKLKTAVHSPGRFRVIGTLSNSVDFAREFKCPPGSPMNPTGKCTVW